MAKLKIIGDGSQARIFIDNNEDHGITSLKLDMLPTTLPKLTLTVVPSEYETCLDDAFIRSKRHKLPRCIRESLKHLANF